MKAAVKPAPTRPDVLDVALRNPYDAQVRLLRRELEIADRYPRDVAGWRRWWMSLPEPVRHDDAAVIVFLAGAGGSVPPTETWRVIDREGGKLPEALRASCSEMATRSLAVRGALDGLIGDTEVMRDVRRTGWAAAFGERLDTANSMTGLFQTTPVLIQGDTGTGKELVAKALSHSMRGKWVPEKGWRSATPDSNSIHLASIPPDLVQSVLFGHERGAFTGAEKRTGILERCHNGVVFLDEIAELPPSTQVALLRTLQQGEVLPIGADACRPAAPRIVSATHRDLEELVALKQFRKDLFYRLSSVIIRLPPLKDRRTDIPLLVEKEVKERVSADARTELTDKFQDFLKKNPDYSWPGNVRELQAVVRALALGLPPRLRQQHDGEMMQIAVPVGLAEATWGAREAQDWYFQRVLARVKTETRAAAVLGVDRGTVRRHKTGARDGD